MKQPTIALVGAGALGVLYGEKLAAAYGKERAFFLADRARAERYRRDGFSCNGRPCDFHYVTPGAHEKPADLVLFAVKIHALREAAALARPFVGDETALVSVLNGITSEGILAEELAGRGQLLYCVAQGMDATKTGNRLTYQNSGKLLLGLPDGRTTPALTRAAQLLQHAGICCQVVDNIRFCLWNKLMLNTGINQVTAVYGIPYGGIQRESEARRTVEDAMREVQAVAACEGVSLSDADREAWMRMLDTLDPDGMPSMRQDTLARRPTEVELFAGTIRRLGKQHGVPTPVNDFLYRRIREMEASWS